MKCFLCNHPYDFKSANGLITHLHAEHLPENPKGGKFCWCGAMIASGHHYFVVHLVQTHDIQGIWQHRQNYPAILEDVARQLYDLYHVCALGVTP